jgi:hypothetical protein
MDGELLMNLPLDPVLATADAVPTLCIASDLLPLPDRRLGTVSEASSRTKDLIFAVQMRDSLPARSAKQPATPWISRRLDAGAMERGPCRWMPARAEIGSLRDQTRIS